MVDVYDQQGVDDGGAVTGKLLCKKLIPSNRINDNFKATVPITVQAGAVALLCEAWVS